MRKRRNTDGDAAAVVQDGADDHAGRAPAPASSDTVLLGRIVAAHGLRGEVKILTYTEAPENIAAYGPLSDGKGRSFNIDDVRPQKGGAVVARLAGVADRNGAERLRGTELYISRQCLPAPDEEEWYYSDLVGLQAVTPAGEPFGEVVSVQNFGAGDLLELRRPGERQTQFLAFTQANVPAVDIAGGTMTIVPPREIIAAPPEDEGAPGDGV